MRDDAFILGMGYVGKATAKVLDIPWHFSRHDANITLKDGAKKKYCIICLPTPTNEQGNQGEAIQTIISYIKQIVGFGGHPLFVIRSTVLPGTCDFISKETKELIASNPEFLSEATAYEDALNPKIKVLGANEPLAMKLIDELWRDIPSKLTIRCGLSTAEMIKYTFNTFAATKVVFANTIYDACQKTGADYATVHMALHKHPWGSKHHLKPVDKGGRGAGGHCIPKDLKAFATWSNSELLQTVERVNKELLQSTKKE